MSFNLPLVSIILPTYNRAKLLSRSIKSILNQTYSNFELIIVDDGSTDNTESIVKEFQRKDKRIKYIKHEKNRGFPAAQNTGIKLAQGTYVAFQDSDDEWLPEKLEKQLEIIKKNPQICVVFTKLKYHKGNKIMYIPEKWNSKKEENIAIELLKKNFISTQTLLIKKESFSKAGTFDENLQRLLDWDLMIRFSKICKIKYIDEPLVNVYYTDNSISSDEINLYTSIEYIINKHYKDFLKNKKILANWYLFLARKVYLSGNKNKFIEYAKKSIQIYPFIFFKLFLIILLLFLLPNYAERIINVKHSIIKFFGS